MATSDASATRGVALRGGVARGFERGADVALAVSFAGWAVMGLVESGPGDRWTAVRLSVSALNAAVAVLLLVRRGAVTHGRSGALVAALPGLLVGGVAMGLAPGAGAWPGWASAVFVVGAAWAVVSLARLGRSFGLLPAVRGLVTGGPYRVVRHPAYVGELVMVGACGAARGDAWGGAVVAAAVVLVAVRVVAEESAWRGHDGYAAYRGVVRWRLLPGVW